MMESNKIRINFSAELYDQIIFGMENQDQEMVLDPVRSVVFSLSTESEANQGLNESEQERLLPLPEWGPARGFNLMESFVAQLHNPEAKKLLKTALETKKGVFRNFKMALKEWSEFEKLWFSFKNKQMEVYIRSWYEDLIEIVPDESEPDQDHTELILEDFQVKSGSDISLEIFCDLDKRAFSETCVFTDSAYIEWAFRKRSDNIKDKSPQKNAIAAAFGPQNEPAGFFWAYLRYESETLYEWEIVQLAVEPMWRGLGLGSVLWEAGLKILKTRGAERVLFSPGLQMNQLVKTRMFDGIKTEIETFSFLLGRD